MLVETIYDDISMSAPIDIPASFNISDDNIFGYRYAYINQTWIPLEFSAYSQDNPNIAERNKKLAESDAFLLELGEKLREMQLENVFGVGIKTRDHFQGLQGGNTGTSETEIGLRTLQVTANTDFDKELNNPDFDDYWSSGYTAPAFWQFNRRKKTAIDDCYSHGMCVHKIACCRHCNHCRHCRHPKSMSPSPIIGKVDGKW